MGELTFFLVLQVKQKDNGIFISQDKYVADILKKFDFSSVKTASTPLETNKALIKDEEAEDVDVHLYRSMIGSLMYLTASRPDIMFAVCACARFQVTPKTSHLHAVKRIFRYLKGQPKLGLWYPRDSPFDLEAFSDSDYAGASLDRKSTTGGCQFLGKRLISWQCKKQTIVANSTTEAEYVAAANCYGQVLWIQNQMLDYGFNFMNTKIYNDNESTIYIVKNPESHSKTKHIEIRHHFIRDSYEKKFIQVIKIHTDQNVADLLTKAFDVSRVKTAKAKHIEYLVGDEAVHKELGDRMERAVTTASSFEAEHDSGSGPRCQDTILGDIDVQTRFEIASKQINDPPFSKVSTFGSGEDSMQLMELIAHFTRLGYALLLIVYFSKRDTFGSPLRSFAIHPHSPLTPTTPPSIQTTHEVEETATMPHDSPLPGGHTPGSSEGRLKHDELMELVTKLSDRVMVVKGRLEQIKKTFCTYYYKVGLESEEIGEASPGLAKPRRRARIVLSEDEDTVEDPSKQGRKIAQIDIDPTISLVQDEGTSWFQEDIETQEKNSADIEEECNQSIGQRKALCKNLCIQKNLEEGSSTMSVDGGVSKRFKRRKQATAMAEQEQKGSILIRPYSVAKVRKNMVMYLKNQAGYKQKKLAKESEEAEEQTLAKKRAGEKQSDQSAKRQKTENDTENEELKAYLDIVLGEEFAMDFESLATKFPIVDWKTHVLAENFMYYQIFRADGSFKNYKIFSEMLDDFDRQDVF
ncbi:hypothetical protein Tco_1015980 [Tanacetum coccineum]|uniref:Uncharacterized protein n=1 Tax=Tanacetum coccineum TaxID=301880 RepID=A0ABQ5FNK7_9ASTR